MRVLGDELRHARRTKGWTREQLRAQLRDHYPDLDISIKTIETYERGTRQCSVLRLDQLCIALAALPHDLLAKVHALAHPQDAADSLPDTGGLVALDLDRVMRDQQPELLPLRNWAHERVLHDPHPDGRITYLRSAAVDHLAAVCGLSTTDLMTHLAPCLPTTSTAHDHEHHASA
jgi:transcriptional regulator with XRE-family HTH domain